MPSVARLGDPLEGMTSSEHSGHDIPHGSVPITGSVSGGCSTSVFVNGEPACIVGAITIEKDDCCGQTPGSVSVGSSSVYVDGKPLSYIGEKFPAHDGTVEISYGSPNVFCGR